MKTPCIKVCTLTPDGRECTGCKRTPAEIAGWSTMTDEQREVVMQRCLAHVWGTKCRDCLDYSKHDLAEQHQDLLNDIERGLF